MKAVLAVASAVTAALTFAAPAHAASPRPPVGAVAVIGDFGSGGPAERRVADLVTRTNPAAIVTAGDNVYDSNDYDRLVGDYYGRWVDRGLMFPATGNHDYAEGIDAFDAYFPYLNDLRTYTRVVGSIQFFVLDSQAALDSAGEMRRQRAWLSWALPRSRAAWQVVVLHHPPYSSGTTHGSTVQFRWPYGRWGADLVVSGHEHDYERLIEGGTTYVVDGTGGKDLYRFGPPVPGSTVRFAADHGALFLTATPARLAGEFWTAGGRLVDRFTLRP